MRRFEVVDNSMSPTLEPGDYLVAGTRRRPRRFDVVVFEHPDRVGFLLVKRVIGLPGETVAIVDGEVRVDGDPLDGPHDAGPDGSWPVGKRQVFVLSDARQLTRADSRSFGPVDSGGLLRVWFRYWPRLGRIPPLGRPHR